VEVSDLTQILERVEQGNPKAADQLLPLVYEELRRLAAQKMANEAAGQTLQPTALVHEAWLRLIGTDNTRLDTNMLVPFSISRRLKQQGDRCRQRKQNSRRETFCL